MGIFLPHLAEEMLLRSHADMIEREITCRLSFDNLFKLHHVSLGGSMYVGMYIHTFKEEMNATA